MHSLTRGPCRLAVEAKEAVFFGLPQAPGVLVRMPTKRFCTAKLLMPDLQSINITNAGICKAGNGGFGQQRPATVVVARVEAQQAAALVSAKRDLLDCTCPVSIDWQRSPEERKRRQTQRLARRQVGQEEGDFEPFVGQQGEGRARVEGSVATLH